MAGARGDHRDAAGRWARTLAQWTIPDAILAVAPENPWGFPPALFDSRDAPVGALHRLAAAALPDGGTVLDVGCGGGAASMPLAGRAAHLTGVDRSPAMLASFARAAEQRGVGHTEVRGEWPAVAGDVPPADVVVCRNVAYNVPGVVELVTSLTDHATGQVVVELTEEHPSVTLAPLWMAFWGLERPRGPTAGDFAEVLDDLGYRPVVERETRPASKANASADQVVAFVRRRLCLDPSRDPEVAAALAGLHGPGQDVVTSVVFAWSP